VVLNVKGGYSSFMNAANSEVRVEYRMYITWRFASPSGSAPVKRMTNHDTMLMTWDKTRNPYKTTKCGIASNQLTRGRQFATFSGGSNVKVAGYGALLACMSAPLVEPERYSLRRRELGSPFMLGS
jgi:hypothetical protein